MVKELSDIVPRDYDSDKEITCDNFEESITSSPLEVVPVIMEFTDVSLKGITPILSEVTLMITELTDISLKDNTLNLSEVTPIITKSVIFSEDLPDKLPPTCDIQHTIELILGANLSDLSHPRLNLTKQNEFEGKLMS